jgi:uncharacterized sulfatase
MIARLAPSLSALRRREWPTMLRHACMILFLAATAARSPAGEAVRPNILWLVSEDHGAEHLRLYSEAGIELPNVEKLAAHGVVFEHAFSTAPVCSVARTALMSGVVPSRVGAQHHRPLEKPQMPEGMGYFPTLLRDAGYFTTNASKTDLNIATDDPVFHRNAQTAHWRERPDPSMPFFHMRTFMISHESRMHGDGVTAAAGAIGEQAWPAELPDTAEFRTAAARLTALHRQLDAQVGQVLDELESDGLADSTIVFFFGDHGGVLPRSKSHLYEGGLHVPLVIRIPEPWRAETGLEPGGRYGGFISFIDFAPTVLRLAGVEPPSWIDGDAFLGRPGLPGPAADRNVTFGIADRMDEKVDFVRSVRRGNLKYIRCRLPFYPDGLNNHYRFDMPAYHEWRELYRRGELEGAHAAFFEPRPPELLFDLADDPREIRNLAGDPSRRAELLEMRALLQQHTRDIPDLSFLPENVMLREIAESVDSCDQRRVLLARLAAVSDLMLLPFDEAREDLVAALDDLLPLVQYHALIVCTAFGEDAAGMADRATAMLDSDDPLVVTRAAEFLGWIKRVNPVPHLRRALAAATEPAQAGIILNTVIAMNDHLPHVDAGRSWNIANPDARSRETARQLRHLRGDPPAR